jgi:hypothetical protein
VEYMLGGLLKDFEKSQPPYRSRFPDSFLR